MAQITLTYNTQDKTVNCLVDGKELDDITYFCLSRYDEADAYLEISFEPKRENGVTTYTRVVASENVKPYENAVKFSSDSTLVVANKSEENKEILGKKMADWVSLSKHFK